MNEKSFHESRRAFIIIPDTGILFAEKNVDLSHKKMLTNLGIDNDTAEKIIENSPRGYFLDNQLVFYIGDFMPISDTELTIIKKYLPDFKSLFNLDENSQFFSGVKKGKVGEIWPPLKRITI